MANQSDHPGFDPIVADELLKLLSSDDKFRQTFHDNPVAALASLGHTPAVDLPKRGGDAQTAFACMETKSIAPKEEILAARVELLAYLTAGGNHTSPHAFEAGLIMAALQRKPQA
ncbi:NHLP-related RiPP peptide [Lysobacter sp. CA199]|uniref:NHLP-related RiPP peptide n=1 Tax=Lysobacter sp. CA199 TaxID=3455608 RepID=UPI003F8D8374